MEAGKAIEARRSIRKYQPADVPQEHIRSMLEAAMRAPSACNTRPWEFFVIRDAALKRRLAAVSPYCRQVIQAPVCIVVCGRPDLQEAVCSPYWQQDCGAAIENLLLAAVDLGYGTCWCGLYPSAGRAEAVEEILGCQGVPTALITVGVPDEVPPPRKELPLERIHYM